VPAAERPAAPPFVEAAGQVMFRQVAASIRGKGFLAAAAVTAIAPILAIAIRDPSPVVLVRIVAFVLLPFLLPLLAVSLGSGLLYDEAEEGTLTFLFTTPVSKSAIVLGKWAAALGTGWAVAALSLGLTLALSPVPLDGMGPFVRACWLAVLIGYPAYLGVFTLLGALFRRGFLAGLIYAYGYEIVVSHIPGGAKRLSLLYFLRSLLEPVAPDRSPFEGAFVDLNSDPEIVCLAVLASAAILSVALALLVVPRKEFRARNVQG
jgi:ABC-2 type transport system permease protein